MANFLKTKITLLITLNLLIKATFIKINKIKIKLSNKKATEYFKKRVREWLCIYLYKKVIEFVIELSGSWGGFS